jgi:hypothetical protein
MLELGTLDGPLSIGRGARLPAAAIQRTQRSSAASAPPHPKSRDGWFATSPPTPNHARLVRHGYPRVKLPSLLRGAPPASRLLLLVKPLSRPAKSIDHRSSMLFPRQKYVLQSPSFFPPPHMALVRLNSKILGGTRNSHCCAVVLAASATKLCQNDFYESHAMECWTAAARISDRKRR